MKRHTDESHSLTGAARIAWRRSVVLCCVGGVQSRGGDGRELLYCGGGRVGLCHPDNQQTAFWELITVASGL